MLIYCMYAMCRMSEAFCTAGANFNNLVTLSSVHTGMSYNNRNTFGIKFIASSTVAVARQMIPVTAYLTTSLLPNRTMTGATAIPATTMV